MLRKVMIIVMILMTAICVVGIYKKYKDVQPDSTLPDRAMEINSSPLKPMAKIPDAILAVNQKNKSYNTFVCEDVEYKLWQSGHRFRLSGSVYYEKDMNFRMEIQSVFGTELDVGSNKEEFWYWSKRDRNPGLHWAKHEDFEKTRLKTPFNPSLLKASFGLDVLGTENAKFVENQKDIMVVYPGKSGSGQPVLYSVFVNKQRQEIDGFLVTDPTGKHLAAAEIQSRANGLPTAILFTWYEENRVMLIRLNRPAVNQAISPSKWKMPGYTPKINIGEQ